MGLPGGRRNTGDPDLFATATRETAEEVGLALQDAKLLGTLDDVWPRSPHTRLIVVRPYVFAVADRPQLTLSDEVAEAHWVSFAELGRPELYRDTAIQLGGLESSFPAYHLEPGVVWGLTERILTPLLQLTN